ncbi:MAG: FKBP-type peptidyl-prolyl cis-trans isomerase [Bacteroidota bacterium]
MNTIGENRVVTITYDLRENSAEGELLERMNANYPFTFLFGTGALLPAFEANLKGLTERDSFEFVLSPSEAYGAVEEANIVNVPRAVFQVEGAEPPNLVVQDNFVALTDDQGETHHGQIVDINDLMVKVNFNHVMAGKQLHFKGAILNIRPASVDEIIRQHHIPESGIKNRGIQ